MAHKKHLMNDPENIVVESLRGLCYANPTLRLMENNKVVYRADIDQAAKNEVTIISGGGSGHEPAHASFVGDGMLSAAVCGNIFASPTTAQIVTALRRVKSPHGTLIIVKNYTGDNLNFGLAAEKVKAEGQKVEIVIVADDVAVGREKGGLVGRRGLAATVLVHKVAGAVARARGSLDQVRAAAQYVIDHSATIGVGLDHCHVPGSTSHHSLEHHEAEIGMGIHNEPGFQKVELPPLKSLISTLLDKVLSQTDSDRSYLSLSKSASRLVLLVNNLGATSALELGVVTKEATEELVNQGYTIDRVLAGPFVTSLAMPGFSLTVFGVEKDAPVAVGDLLGEPVGAPGWANAWGGWVFDRDVVDKTEESGRTSVNIPEGAASTDPTLFKKALTGLAKSLIAAEPVITKYDTVLGDGDCGTTLKSGAQAILSKIDSFPLTSAPRTVLAIAELLEPNMGGTSGALYGIYLNALVTALVQNSNGGPATKEVWGKSAEAALKSLETYTPARVGSRTMMDALIPFVETLTKSNNLDEAVKAAEKGAEHTKALKARLGRASYVGDEAVEKAGIPDAGAWGIKVLVEGLRDGLSS